MSLVNDALKKARLEAARGDAANRGVPYPALGRGERTSSRAWIVAFGGFVLLAGLGGFLLFRAGKQAALRTETVAQARTSSAAESTATSHEPGGAAGKTTEEATAEASGKAEPTPGAASVPDPARSRQPTPSPVASSPRPGAMAEPADSNGTAGTNPAARPARSLPAPQLEPGPQSEPKLEPKLEPRLDNTRPVRTAPAPTPPASESRPASPNATRPVSEGTRRSQGRGDAPSASPPSEPPAPEAPRPDSMAPTVEVVRSADIPGVGPVELGGIAWSGDRPFALLNGRVVRPGDSVAGLMVAEIQSNTVRLSGAAGDWVLKLK